MPSLDPRQTPVTLPRSARPAVVDEWGLYDPEQAGLAALFDRVEEKRRVTGESDSDADLMAASMQEANRLAESSARDDQHLRDLVDMTPVRGSGWAFLP